VTTPTDSTKRPLEPYDEALGFLDHANYQEAVRSLSDQPQDDPTGALQALLGTAYFHLEKYGDAARSFEAALQRDPDNVNWKSLLDIASANAVAAVNMRVLTPRYFNANELLAPAAVPASLPAPTRHSPRTMLTHLRLIIGESAGRVASVAVDASTWALGKIPGYRGRLWTKWCRQPYLIGLLVLAHMRDQLNKHNLFNTYPEGSLTGFQPLRQSVPPGVESYRTADGTWNSLANPKEGAAGTRFLRNVPNHVVLYELEQDVMSPDPRVVSRVLLTRAERMKEVPCLNLLAAAWINFQNHDWIHHGEPLPDEFFEIPLAEDDPIRIKHHQLTIKIPKTQRDPTFGTHPENMPITFINEVTHWWDGSQIYGSDQETVDRLRSHIDGKLRITDDRKLPLDTSGIEETGFTRNWWVGLSIFHTLFVLEHNAICERLKETHPDFSDEHLFNVARLINAAVMAKIHTIEWVPAILANRKVWGGANANWYGLLTNAFNRGKRRKTLARINVRNLEMGGAVGNPVNNHGSPYGLTEEFTEVYRLHSLLPDRLALKRIDTGGAEDVPVAATRQAGSAKLIERYSVPELIYSFGNQHPGELALNNFPRFMQEMSVAGNAMFDLGALDILRCRERGVPRYNEFRRQLHLNPINSFNDLTNDAATIRDLESVYGTGRRGVEQLDLTVGTLAEAQNCRPDGFGFGETLFQIFILNATRRLQADRFYTDSYNEETYTQEGLDWIDNADLKTILLHHYPELAQTGLSNIKNAFEPWDISEELDPDRHPLRAFDPELSRREYFLGPRRDPWRGDKAR